MHSLSPLVACLTMSMSAATSAPAQSQAYAKSDALSPTPLNVGLAAFNQSAKNSDEGDHHERELPIVYRLLRLEEAYTQERGEWRFRLTTEYTKGTFTERESTGFGLRDVTKETVKTLNIEMEVEYGLTDRLEFELEIPVTIWQHRRGWTGETQFEIPGPSTGFGFDEGDFGDVFVGLGYALFQETSTAPAVTVSLGAILPTGDEREGTGTGRGGFSTGVSVTKGYDRFFAIANVEFAYAASQSREFEYGVGFLYFLSDERDWSISLEFDASAEEDYDTGHWEHTFHVTPGISYGWEVQDRYEWQIGLGVPFGLTGVAEESDDFGVILQVQLEF